MIDRTIEPVIFRESNGNEIDLLTEKGRDLCGVEIKSGTTINPDYSNIE